MTLDNILEEVNNAETILIIAHEQPDGDAVGSSLGMKLALEKIGKKPDVIMTKVAKVFDFLPDRDEIKEKADIEKYDLVISLDCATIDRLVGKEYFEKAKKTIVIDHHGSNQMYGDINYVDPVSPACCQILAEMFQYFNIEIDKEIGTCLITGIITDTGGFKYSGVTSETFEITQRILENGVKISEIYKKVMDTKTRANFELTKIVMNRMEFLLDGKVALTYINNSDFKEAKAEEGDHEGLVEIGRGIEGVEVSVFIRQKEDDDSTYKLSLRSNEYVNVSDVCLMFNGGGHERAAGASIEGDLETVKEKILKTLEKFIKM